uniref:Pyr_redox_2 domain-containing protein n=1 Tax=Haemonchus contortus TaxID=6289 RepID=A0A7I5ECA5_HAECO
EIASAASLPAASVTVVCMTEEPLPPLGSDIGAVIKERFVAKGVKVLVNATAERLEGEGEVTGATLKSGETIPADVVVAGIGVQPPTAWLKNTRIELNEAGFINVDRHFRVREEVLKGKVVISYVEDDVVVAVACAGPIPTAIQFLEIFERKIDVTREDVEKNTSNDWLTLLDE